MNAKQDTQNQPEAIGRPTGKAGFGAPKTSTALFMMFEAAAKSLTQKELEYLVRLNSHAQLEAANLAISLQTIGALIYNVEPFEAPSSDSIGQMLWSLSSQLDHIAGLIEVSSNASYQLKALKNQNQHT
ncbi:MAG: hypothetical protein Q7U57_07640 [Methylovulum sp.]|nr:hypothetical protein [Methylovulum sp.]